jgi:hypothetical protein
MSFQGKLRIRRVGNVFHFESKGPTDALWTTVKETTLPFTEAGFAAVVSENSALPTSTPIEIRAAE